MVPSPSLITPMNTMEHVPIPQSESSFTIASNDSAGYDIGLSSSAPLPIS